MEIFGGSTLPNIDAKSITGCADSGVKFTIKPLIPRSVMNVQWKPWLTPVSVNTTPDLSKAWRMARALFGTGLRRPRSKSATVDTATPARVANSCWDQPTRLRAARTCSSLGAISDCIKSPCQLKNMMSYYFFVDLSCQAYSPPWLSKVSSVAFVEDASAANNWMRPYTSGDCLLGIDGRLFHP